MSGELAHRTSWASLRAIPILGLALAIVVFAAWQGQDISGFWIIGSFTAAGLFLVWRRPGEVVGWLLVAFALAFETLGLTIPGSSSQVVGGQAGPWVTFLAWINSWGSGLFIGTLIALAALFPSGRFPTGRLGLVSRVAVATPVVFAVVLAFAPELTMTFDDGVRVAIRLPFGVAPDWPGWPGVQSGVFLAVIIALAASIGTLVARFRGSNGAEREQYKWFLAALAATLATVVFAFVMMVIVGDEDATWMWWPAVFAYPLIPAAIGIAVLRYRLYEIDRIISRTIGWALVTGILAAVFVGVVIALQALLAGFTQGDTLAVAASTLLAFALFQPLRRRVQRVVDRRFDRARYDGQRTVDAFAERLRDEVDLAGVEGDITATVREALRPGSVAVWVRTETSSRGLP
jgi:hypothetical protein